MAVAGGCSGQVAISNSSRRNRGEEKRRDRKLRRVDGFGINCFVYF